MAPKLSTKAYWETVGHSLDNAPIDIWTWRRKLEYAQLDLKSIPEFEMKGGQLTPLHRYYTVVSRIAPETAFARVTMHEDTSVTQKPNARQFAVVHEMNPFLFLYGSEAVRPTLSAVGPDKGCVKLYLDIDAELTAADETESDISSIKKIFAGLAVKVGAQENIPFVIAIFRNVTKPSYHVYSSLFADRLMLSDASKKVPGYTLAARWDKRVYKIHSSLRFPASVTVPWRHDYMGLFYLVRGRLIDREAVWDAPLATGESFPTYQQVRDDEAGACVQLNNLFLEGEMALQSPPDPQFIGLRQMLSINVSYSSEELKRAQESQTARELQDLVEEAFGDPNAASAGPERKRTRSSDIGALQRKPLLNNWEEAAEWVIDNRIGFIIPLKVGSTGHAVEKFDWHVKKRPNVINIKPLDYGVSVSTDSTFCMIKGDVHPHSNNRLHFVMSKDMIWFTCFSDTCVRQCEASWMRDGLPVYWGANARKPVPMGGATPYFIGAGTKETNDLAIDQASGRQLMMRQQVAEDRRQHIINRQTSSSAGNVDVEDDLLREAPDDE